MELPPGFRFRPTEEELITHYLSPKIRNPNLSFEGLVLEVDIYKFHPAEVTVKYGGNGQDGTWYFFTQVNRRFKKGSVINRETPKGTWKASTAAIVRDGKGVKIGVIKKLVFWETKEESEVKKKTDWMLHEYRIQDSVDSCVLCKIYHKKKNELDANESKIKGTQPLNQIPPVIVAEPSSDIKPQPKNQTFDDNLAKNHHKEQSKPESSKPVTCLEPFYESYDQPDSVSYLLQDFGSDGFSEIFPDSAVNFHAVLNQLSYTAKQVQTGSACDNNLNSSNFDKGGQLNNTKSSNFQPNNIQKC